MSRFLLTGCYGFIGSEVLNRIFKKFPSLEKVVMIDRIDYNSRERNVDISVRQDPRYIFVKGDITSYDLISFILEKYRIDTVIHMASQTHVGTSFESSLQFTRDNILGTHSLIEACRKCGKIQRFIHMSTDEVYGEADDESHHENCLLNPTNPYAATKASAEFILKSYGHSFKFPYVIIRGNNVYGRGQYPDKLIPKFILLAHSDQKLPIHGSGGSQRMFVHVDDMVDGILLVTEKGVIGETYNIGSRNEFSVLEISREICQQLGKRFEDLIEYVQDRSYNDKRYYIGYDKVQRLGWKEKVPFEKGLQETIQWYVERSEEFAEKI